MMISEETLTLYFYDDGLDAAERRAVEQALQHDAVLRARYADLTRHLKAWREPARIVAPLHMKQRWHDGIDRAALAELSLAEEQSLKKAAPLHFMSFIWGAALTAALAIGIGIGFWFSAADPANPFPDNILVDIPELRPDSVPVSFTRGLQLHLQESQWEIASLADDDSERRALLAMQLIAQNRQFERTATMNNSPELARVLRAFEPVLAKLASDETSPEDSFALREKLAFELGVMLTKLSRDSSDVAETI